MTQKVIAFNRGSKRRLKQIRWKITEIASLTLLAIFMIAIAMVIVLWEIHHEHPYSEPPKHPQVRDAQPTEP